MACLILFFSFFLFLCLTLFELFNINAHCSKSWTCFYKVKDLGINETLSKKAGIKFVDEIGGKACSAIMLGIIYVLINFWQ